jgi:PAS domain S-box-containing protein
VTEDREASPAATGPLPARERLSRLSTSARVGLGLAGMDVGLGVAVLLGGLAGVPAVTSLGPGPVAMKPNVAISLALLGTALVLRLLPWSPTTRRRVIVLCDVLALIVLAIVLATLYEYVASTSLGIDEALSREQPGIGTPYPGRPPVPVAVALAAAALATILLGRRWLGYHPGQALAVFTAAVGGLVLLGYAYGAPELTALGAANRTSFLAAPGLLLAGLALVAADAEHGLVRQFADPGPAGQTARRVVPAALLVVPVGTFLWLAGERAGLYDMPIGLTIMTVFEALVLLAAGAWASGRILGLEAARAEIGRDRDRFFELASDLVLVTDLSGRALQMSPSWEAAIGRPREEMLGRPFLDFVHPDDRAATKRAFEADILAGLGVSGFVNRYPCPDDTYRWLEWSSKADLASGRVFAAARDVTEQKRAQEILSEASAHSRGLIEASLDPLVTISPQGKITDVNRATEQATGHSREELVGTDFADYFTEPEHARAGYQQVLYDGLVRDYPLTIRHKSGRTTDVLYNATVYRNQRGELQGVFAAARDVTEQKRAQERLLAYADQLAKSNEETESARRQLEQSAEELRRSNAELEQFANVASHDLQEPLRMVTGFVGLLERRYKGQLGAEADEYIGFAVEGAHRMQYLINDLLTYSRVGTRAQEFEPVDLGEAASEALGNLRVAIEESQARVKCGKLPTVRADRRQMVQLLQNLVGNAVKFHGQAKPEVRIGARRTAGGWRVFVRDNGIGIAPEHQEHVFVIFRRLHSREAYPGSGIGLAICKKIVERHGGRLWVESTPGQGSTFWLTLPDMPRSADASTR